MVLLEGVNQAAEFGGNAVVRENFTWVASFLFAFSILSTQQQLSLAGGTEGARDSSRPVVQFSICLPHNTLRQYQSLACVVRLSRIEAITVGKPNCECLAGTLFAIVARAVGSFRARVSLYAVRVPHSFTL
jgi:hypothetical protein